MAPLFLVVVTKMESIDQQIEEQRAEIGRWSPAQIQNSAQDEAAYNQHVQKLGDLLREKALTQAWVVSLPE